MTVITRFAPSPTGFLHIGGARTALFNFLFAQHHGGKFVLRIEDTDHQRSSKEYTLSIIEGLRWLGIEWNDELIFQSQRKARHVEVVHQLLQAGLAYKCYATPEELENMRQKARNEGRAPIYDGRWRDCQDAPPFGVQPVIRLKTSATGQTFFSDGVQGDVCVDNEQVDDMILMRSDGTPVYLLAVVVDDYDMKISHVMRGVDHLTNTVRQLQIYHAMGWTPPHFSHIPLIHGADGAKLSKRHGALDVREYEALGFLPEALCNYLLRLGWSHGDDEIISHAQAVSWFNGKSLGVSAARFDQDKLNALNAHYIRQLSVEQAVEKILPKLQQRLKRHISRDRLEKIMPLLLQRVKTLQQLEDDAVPFVISEIVHWQEGAYEKFCASDAIQKLLNDFSNALMYVIPWTLESLESMMHDWLQTNHLTMKDVAMPLRVALTGRTVSPGLFDVMHVLGLAWTRERIYAACVKHKNTL